MSLEVDVCSEELSAKAETHQAQQDTQTQGEVLRNQTLLLER